MTDFFALNSKKLLENAHIGVIIHRWDTSIIYANPTALHLLYSKPLELQLGGKGTQPHELRRTK
tara:strand:- start:103 stop:294 length:192 start_codon:yes stop_codon:yes gene_type:complete